MQSANLRNYTKLKDYVPELRVLQRSPFKVKIQRVVESVNQGIEKIFTTWI
jgi:hypothetical protein